MNPLIQQKKITSLLVIVLLLACFALPERAQAVVPAPDGGYAGGNTAEGQSALFGLTTGGFNTAVGFLSLRSNTTNSFNTAVGAGTLLGNAGDENTAIGAGALFSNTTGGLNTATGALALFSNTTGYSNTANGRGVLFNNATGFENTATGVNALFSNVQGNSNTATGAGALLSNQGSDNTANGLEALFSNTTGSSNTAIGLDALVANTSGGDNTALGSSAGVSVTTANNVICIGANVAGANVDFTTWINGIYGVTTVSGTTLPVVVSNTGQLGTASSSRRFKKEIKPMEKTSESILALKPVTFYYKTDKTGTPQFGLIAEEVAEVNSDLIVRDENGEIYTVRYDAVNAMLLNEFLKEHKKTEKLEATVASLIATVKEQAAQIQKVSAQLEVHKPAPQTVLNNQ
jgi:hypothetical protein